MVTAPTTQAASLSSSARARRATSFLGVLCLLLAATAIPGAILLAAGIDAPPLVLLRGSPFHSYGWPALALLTIGLLETVSVVMAVRGHFLARPCAAIAALALIAFELVQMAIIGSPPGPARALQLFYLALGGVIASSAIGHESARRAGAVAGSLLSLLLILMFAVRPWYLNWGATLGERLMDLPGDSLVATAESQTRAVTIHAPVERVWPWLAQLGQERAGFYSYDLLENLVGCEMPTDDTLRPEYQRWALGDRLWMYPKDAADGTGFATLRAFEPGRALVFATHAPGSSQEVEDGTWAFVLRPIDSQATRLLVRDRGTPRASLLGRGLMSSVFEPMHFTMERRMMLGVKDLAERGYRHRALNHVNIGLWTVVVALIMQSLVRTLQSTAFHASLWTLLGAVALWGFLTLRQPHVLLAAALVVLLAIAQSRSWRGVGRPARSRSGRLASRAEVLHS